MKCLISTNSPWAGTGYGQQCKGIARGIKALGYQVAIQGWWGLEGGAIEWEGITVFPRHLDGYGNDASVYYCRKWHADLLITLIDLWVVDPQLGHMGNTRWCPLFPIDSNPISPPVAERFPHAYRLLCYSKDAVKLVSEHDGGKYADRVRYLPHGIPADVLVPGGEDEKRTLRRKFFPDWPEDAYICFPPDTKVTLPDGAVQSIQDVQIGNIVLDANGKPVSVLKCLQRPYKGELVGIEVTGREALWATPEHPVLAIKRARLSCDKCDSFHQRGYVCRQDDKRNYSNSMCATCQSPLLNKVRPEYLPAETLEPGDFLMSPVLSSNDPTGPTHFDIADIIRVDGTVTATTVRGRGVKRAIPRIIPLNDHFCELLGLYVADGNLYRRSGGTEPNGICITVGPDKEEALRIAALFESVFHLTSCIRRTGCKGGGIVKPGDYVTYSVVCTHKDMAQLFKTLGAEHAADKRLHKSIFEWPDYARSALLRGLWHGDGAECTGLSLNRPVRRVYTTISTNLAYQVVQLLAMQGIAASIRKEKRKFGQPIYRVSYSESALNEGRLRREHHNMFHANGYTVHEVRATDRMPYDGSVYNLSVDQSHTYITNGVAVHNCTMVAANKGYPSRKSFSEVMEAFALFAARHPEARLYLHSYRGPEMKGPPLDQLAGYYGILDRVRLANPTMLLAGDYTDQMMRDLYVSADVLLSPSQGEGFGLPILEAQSSGLPVIVTDHSAMSENVGLGWRVPPLRIQPTLIGGGTALADVQGIMHAMEECYRRPKSAYWTAIAREFALQFHWPTVIERYWKPFLAEMDGGRRELAMELESLCPVA